REKAFIGGQWVGAASGRTLDVFEPASGEILGSVPDCDDGDTRAAIDAAATAFKAWRALTGYQRAVLMERWHRLIMQNVADLARILTAEQGKPLKEAASEVEAAAGFVKWYAEEARRLEGYAVAGPQNDRRILVMKEPVGVTAAITPWNFPAAMVARKCAPALAAGCTMVMKPSELTPYTMLALADLAAQAGIPAGVLNVVTGRPERIGAELTSSPIVRKLSFTGSTRIGALLMQQCAPTIKRLSLELGGNAPFIIFDDADLDIVLDAVMTSKFRNAGQTCVSANRILVQDGIFDAFTARLTALVKTQKLGTGFAADTTVGPLIHAQAVTKVRGLVDEAVARGSTVIARTSTDQSPDRFMAPAILAGVTSDMRIAREEIFGPVASLMRFQREDEAVALANGTPYGLASYFFTENIHRAWRVAEQLEAGMVGLNTGKVSLEMAPFGGIKRSGLGREGGRAGLEEYQELKTFHMGGLKTA
ncbi:MAG: NAD-dependent succinate-semialdehyde dehydrogenase, partial [Rhodospirillaceae bacterium]|nr:NAD-dependent succinate-semialdehyde dehydrogenase [Rhodospirillaceae bacterium]